MKVLRVFSWKLKLKMKNCLLKFFQNPKKNNIPSYLTVTSETLDDLLVAYGNSILFTTQKLKFSIKENCGFGHIYWRNP